MPVQTKYLEILKSKLPENVNIYFAYEGAFEQIKIRNFASKIKELTKDNSVIQRRSFYVFVELAQNVKFYSDERIKIDNQDVGMGSLIIYDSKDYFGFIIGNKVNDAAYKVLERKCKIINTMDRSMLREFKRYQRNLIPGTNGGAHIGLIMAALTTRKKLEYYGVPIDDSFHYFILNIILDKK